MRKLATGVAYGHRVLLTGRGAFCAYCAFDIGQGLFAVIAYKGVVFIADRLTAEGTLFWKEY